MLEQALQKAQEENNAGEESKQDNKKNKKKQKEVPTELGFGKGSRNFLNYLKNLLQESNDNRELFWQRFSPFKNLELASVVREIQE